MTGALRAPELGGVGARTADEVLAAAAPALDFFAQWAEIWNAVAPVKIDPDQDVRQKFQDSAGLDFQTFLADATTLAHAHATLAATHADAATAVTTLFRTWQSPAAAAAESAFAHPDELLDHLDAAAQLIPETMTHVFTALQTKVDEALQLCVPSVAGASLPVAHRIVALSEGRAVSQDDLLDLARWLDQTSPGNDLHDRVRDCDPTANDYATRAARQWLTGPFVAEFHSRYTAFQGSCATATSTIDAHFRALTGFLSVPIEASTVEPPAPVELDWVSGSTSGHLELPDTPPETTVASGNLDLPDDSTTASASLSELGAHIVDPPQDRSAPSDLGTAPGGDLTFDPLGPDPTSLPDGMDGFAPLLFPGLPGLGTAPGDPRRTRPTPDVFDTQGFVGRISGSLDDGPGR
ncbi:hypothetical protein ACWEOE_38160 [Amycolatopsis sp. NPDC004368]